ncbi:MAG: TonB-dependent receptor, partial [Bacteroidota bacterium]|nr:TonB-dependent receptor [Bacteroidota bacterium]
MNWVRLITLFLIFVCSLVHAQEKTTVFGTIYDTNRKPLEAVTVAILGETIGSYTDVNGKFEFQIPSDTAITIICSHIGYKQEKAVITVPFGESRELIFRMKPSSSTINEFTIEDKETRSKPITRIDPRVITVLPSAAGGVEAVIKTLPGVSSNNELSSQYNVRGGNFDENLVYVNDIEIYRPLLLRSGQQEGLSFINSDMVSSILFSAGGFDAKYGDKSASVLDIKYRKPVEFGGNASASLLGASFHFEGVTKGYRLTYQVGVRQKSNQYLLGAMETKGDYRPTFTDVQTFITYDVSDKFELNFLGNVSRNKFRMVPQNRQTDFGHVNEALRLTIYFDGQEVDEFNTMTGAVSGIWKPDKNLTLKLISSIFNTRESENFDIQGQYWLDELERDLGKDNFGEVAFNRGIGTYLTHSRNQLKATVINLEHKGYFNSSEREMAWGARIQSENINDRLNEWKMIDSAGYAIPRMPENNIYLQDVLRTEINLNSFRYNGFIQNTWYFGNKTDYSLTAGVRGSYWTINKQVIVSPRLNLSIKPDWEKDFLFRVAAGVYNQPPFYRELRNLEGSVNMDVRAQNSYHFILGSDYNFSMWNRPFKFVSEIYYKHYTNLIPYEVDNVRLRYYAKNNAKGYGTGVDLKINGEFVKGIESWASLSFMKTMEDINDDFYYDYFDKDGKKVHPLYRNTPQVVDSTRMEPGYIPRPTDQRVFFGMFFQDYLPRLPDFKMHLNFLFGSRLPFGPPTHERYKDTLRVPPYRRVD